VGGFSKGMRQRLAIARTLVNDPDIIFLDEPTSGLDPVATREVHRLIERLSHRGRTVFLCTHNLVEAQRLCHRVAVMEQGQMVAVGTPRELAHTSGVDRRYTLEIAPDQAEAARAAVTPRAAVSAVATTDAELTLTVNDREAIPDVLAALGAAHVRVYAVVPQQTSLEDIYMALHRRKGQA
ncbi:MAG: ABC transporter ATP-binding protein, partial [Anaerolineae bacterium]|nr:ABC transporter ATP-binding protein [Anaerolineae bacterium]